MKWINKIKKAVSDKQKEEKELEEIRQIVRHERLIYELEAMVTESDEMMEATVKQIINVSGKKKEVKKLIRYLDKEGEDKSIVTYFAGRVSNQHGIPFELGYYRYTQKTSICLEHRRCYRGIEECYQKIVSAIPDDETKGRLDMLIEEYREKSSKILEDQEEFFAMGYYSPIGLKEYIKPKRTVKIPSSILLRETLE